MLKIGKFTANYVIHTQDSYERHIINTISTQLRQTNIKGH